MLEVLAGWVGNAVAAVAVAGGIGNLVAGAVGMFAALMVGTWSRHHKAC